MNAQDAWSATLGQLQVQLNRATYNTWLGHALYVAYEEGRLVISVPHAYAKDWLEKHLVDSMTDSFARLLGRDAEIQVIVWDPTEEDDDVRSIFGIDDEPTAYCDSDLLDPTKTLENFTLTETSRDTMLFVRFVLESKFGDHPSLFIGGAPGTGKTHLLQAMANVLIGRSLKVVYVSAEQFTTEMVTAIRAKTMEAFREKYRGCDVLIMDEIEFLEGKDSTQEELRYVWDALSRRKRMMVFGSRRLPRDLNINRDLRSCFNRWLLCEIGPLEADTCTAIMDTKALQFDLVLPPDVRDALVERIGGDPTMIDGALMQLASYARMTGQAVSLAMVSSLFRSREASPVLRNLDAYQVMTTVAAYYKLSPTDLEGKRRTKEVNTARQLAMHMARVLTDASLPQIGITFGGRDHSTVLHGIAKIVDQLKVDATLRADMDAIRRMLTSAAPATTPSTSEPQMPTAPDQKPLLPEILELEKLFRQRL